MTKELLFCGHIDDRHEITYPGMEPHGHYCAPILSDGDLLGVLNLYVHEGQARDAATEGFLTAVTDTLANTIRRKRAEDELRSYQLSLEGLVEERTREVREANEEVRQFAFIISHDLRAPLVNITGFSRELRHTFENMEARVAGLMGSLPEDERRALQNDLGTNIPEGLRFIETSAAKINHMAEAVLRLSRLGRREFHREPVETREVVDGCLDALAHLIETLGITVVVGDLPSVVSDRLALDQIFANLLGNAVKYLVPGRPGRIEVWAERDADQTRFQVRDNGRGIAKADIPCVFEPFRRLGKQDTEGEGMGMSYVQTLVRGFGGQIWCESSPGEGSTFSFTLPDSYHDQGGSDE